jgi:hypothetical protein
MLGQWKNFDELEENLCIDELNALLDAMRRAERRREVFQAALKGIDLNEDEKKSTFEEVEKRAKAKLAGVTPEELELGEIGISIETE